MTRYFSLSLSLLLPLALLACSDGDQSKDDTDVAGTDDVDTDVVADTDVDDSDADTGSDTGELAPLSWPGTPENYVFSDTTYISQVRVPPLDANKNATCCRDWGGKSKDNIRSGTNKLDNALSNLAVILDGFGIDVQYQLDATLQTGAFVGLLEHHDHPVGDGTYNMAFFLADFEGSTDYAAASTGEGTFTAQRTGFKGNTGEPSVVFRNVTVTASKLVAKGGHFAISLPLLDGVTLTAPVDDVRIEGDLETDASGISLTNGQLSGYITQDAIFTAYNELIASSCSCLDLSTDIFTKNPTSGSWVQHCVKTAADLCVAPGEDVCVAMGGTKLAEGGYCSTLFSTLPLLADIDTDGTTGSFEALSVGLRVEGVPGEIVGVEAAP